MYEVNAAVCTPVGLGCVLTTEVDFGPFAPAQCLYEIASGCEGAHNVLDH